MNCSKLMIIKIHKIYFMLIFWLYKFDVTKKFSILLNEVAEYKFITCNV